MVEALNPFAEGWTGYIALALCGFAVSEPWRWAGVLLARNVSVDSELFRLSRAISTALIAGLVTRLVIFPAGALAQVAGEVRLVAFLAGLAAFFFLGRRLFVGVLVSISSLWAGHALVGL